MKRFNKLRGKSLMWLICSGLLAWFSLYLEVDGGGAGPDGQGTEIYLFFISLFVMSMSSIFYIAWRILEQIEANKEMK